MSKIVELDKLTDVNTYHPAVVINSIQQAIRTHINTKYTWSKEDDIGVIKILASKLPSKVHPSNFEKINAYRTFLKKPELILGNWYAYYKVVSVIIDGIGPEEGVIIPPQVLELTCAESIFKKEFPTIHNKVKKEKVIDFVVGVLLERGFLYPPTYLEFAKEKLYKNLDNQNKKRFKALERIIPTLDKKDLPSILGKEDAVLNVQIQKILNVNMATKHFVKAEELPDFI